MDTSAHDDALQVREGRGVESLSPRNSGDWVDPAREAINESNEPLRIINVSVRERVIFCVDAHFHKPLLQQSVYSFINDYMDLKKRVAVKTVDFGILLMADRSNRYVPVSSKKQVNNVMVAMSQLQIEDVDAFDFSKVFTDLAEMVELPDPNFHSETLPPPHVYHIIILFGRNRHIPTIESPNPYYFLMASPFVSLDILYLTNLDVRRNKSKKITAALRGLADENKGFFEVCAVGNVADQQRCLASFLGHTLLRFPQKSAMFDIARLPVVYNN